MNRLKCKYHPNGNLIEDFVAGDVICAECGLVVGDRVIDFSSEWRSFANDGDGVDSSRVGMVEDSNNAETSTSITIKQSYDARHLNENGEQKYKNGVAETPVERMLKQCRGYVNNIGERLKLNNNIKSSAMEYIKKLSALKGFTRKKEVVACACLFISCRDQRVERTIKEICNVSETTNKDLNKMLKKIYKSLGLSSKSSNIIDQMGRFCYQLGLKEKFIPALAIDIANKAKPFVNSKPSTLIATSIYMAAFLMNEPVSKSKLKEVTDVSEHTINELFKTFYRNRNQIISQSLIPKLKNSIDQIPTL